MKKSPQTATGVLPPSTPYILIFELFLISLLTVLACTSTAYGGEFAKTEHAQKHT